mmetsp:Transcript_6270/g.15419  ORF Transcript_6270/g.15419 Transcript_6270/m.15419 type:complete len:230 (+) Transcript_6270:218-907(+)
MDETKPSSPHNSSPTSLCSGDCINCCCARRSCSTRDVSSCCPLSSRPTLKRRSDFECCTQSTVAVPGLNTRPLACRWNRRCDWKSARGCCLALAPAMGLGEEDEASPMRSPATPAVFAVRLLARAPRLPPPPLPLLLPPPTATPVEDSAAGATIAVGSFTRIPELTFPPLAAPRARTCGTASRTACQPLEPTDESSPHAAVAATAAATDTGGGGAATAAAATPIAGTWL